MRITDGRSASEVNQVNRIKLMMSVAFRNMREERSTDADEFAEADEIIDELPEAAATCSCGNTDDDCGECENRNRG